MKSTGAFRNHLKKSLSKHLSNVAWFCLNLNKCSLAQANSELLFESFLRDKKADFKLWTDFFELDQSLKLIIKFTQSDSRSTEFLLGRILSSSQLIFHKSFVLKLTINQRSCSMGQVCGASKKQRKDKYLEKEQGEDGQTPKEATKSQKEIEKRNDNGKNEGSSNIKEQKNEKDQEMVSVNEEKKQKEIEEGQRKDGQIVSEEEQGNSIQNDKSPRQNDKSQVFDPHKSNFSVSVINQSRTFFSRSSLNKDLLPVSPSYKPDDVHLFVESIIDKTIYEKKMKKEEENPSNESLQLSLSSEEKELPAKPQMDLKLSQNEGERTKESKWEKRKRQEEKEVGASKEVEKGNEEASLGKGGDGTNSQRNSEAKKEKNTKRAPINPNEHSQVSEGKAKKAKNGLGLPFKNQSGLEAQNNSQVDEGVANRLRVSSAYSTHKSNLFDQKEFSITRSFLADASFPELEMQFDRLFQTIKGAKRFSIKTQSAMSISQGHPVSLKLVSLKEFWGLSESWSKSLLDSLPASMISCLIQLQKEPGSFPSNPKLKEISSEETKHFEEKRAKYSFDPVLEFLSQEIKGACVVNESRHMFESVSFLSSESRSDHNVKYFRVSCFEKTNPDKKIDLCLMTCHLSAFDKKTWEAFDQQVAIWKRLQRKDKGRPDSDPAAYVREIYVVESNSLGFFEKEFVLHVLFEPFKLTLGEFIKKAGMVQEKLSEKDILVIIRDLMSEVLNGNRIPLLGVDFSEVLLRECSSPRQFFFSFLHSGASDESGNSNGLPVPREWYYLSDEQLLRLSCTGGALSTVTVTKDDCFFGIGMLLVQLLEHFLENEEIQESDGNSLGKAFEMLRDSPEGFIGEFDALKTKEYQEKQAKFINYLSSFLKDKSQKNAWADPRISEVILELVSNRIGSPMDVLKRVDQIIGKDEEKSREKFRSVFSNGQGDTEAKCLEATWRQSYAETNVLELNGNYKGAFNKCNQTLACIIKASETEKIVEDTLVVYIRLGEILRKMRSSEYGIAPMLKALTSKERILGENHPEVAICHLFLGRLHFEKKNSFKKEQHENALLESLNSYRKAIQIYSRLPENKFETGIGYYYIGLTFLKESKTIEAIENLEKSLESLPENSSRALNAFFWVAFCLLKTEDYSKASEFSKKALAVSAKIYGRASDLHALAVCMDALIDEKSQKGNGLNERLNQMASEKSLGIQMHLVGFFGGLVFLGDLDKGEHWIKMALQKKTEIFSKRPTLDMGICFVYASLVSYSRKSYEESLKRIEDAIQCFHFLGNCPENCLGNALFIYSRVLFQLERDLEKSKDAASRSREIFKGAFGEDFPWVEVIGKIEREIENQIQNGKNKLGGASKSGGFPKKPVKPNEPKRPVTASSERSKSVAGNKGQGPANRGKSQGASKPKADEAQKKAKK